MIAKEKQDLELLKLKKEFEMELAEQKDINIEATTMIYHLGHSVLICESWNWSNKTND